MTGRCVQRRTEDVGSAPRLLGFELRPVAEVVAAAEVL